MRATEAGSIPSSATGSVYQGVPGVVLESDSVVCLGIYLVVFFGVPLQ